MSAPLPAGPLLGYRLRLALGAALDQARDGGSSRHAVADAVAELAGVTVSKSMLDRWAAPANEQHRLPAELLPAFVIATGSHGPLALLAEVCGCGLVGPSDLRAAEIGRAYADKIAADARLRRALGETS